MFDKKKNSFFDNIFAAADVIIVVSDLVCISRAGGGGVREGRGG